MRTLRIFLRTGPKFLVNGAQRVCFYLPGQNCMIRDIYSRCFCEEMAIAEERQSHKLVMVGVILWTPSTTLQWNSRRPKERGSIHNDTKFIHINIGLLCLKITAALWLEILLTICNEPSPHCLHTGFINKFTEAQLLNIRKQKMKFELFLLQKI